MSNKSELWGGLGTAAIILALCLGVSTCDLIEAQAEAVKAETAREAAVPHAAQTPDKPLG